MRRAGFSCQDISRSVLHIGHKSTQFQLAGLLQLQPPLPTTTSSTPNSPRHNHPASSSAQSCLPPALSLILLTIVANIELSGNLNVLACLVTIAPVCTFMTRSLSGSSSVRHVSMSACCAALDARIHTSHIDNTSSIPHQNRLEACTSINPPHMFVSKTSLAPPKSVSRQGMTSAMPALSIKTSKLCPEPTMAAAAAAAGIEAEEVTQERRIDDGIRDAASWRWSAPRKTWYPCL